MTARRWRRQREEGWGGMVTIAAVTVQYFLDRLTRIAVGPVQVLQSIDQVAEILDDLLVIPHWV